MQDKEDKDDNVRKSKISVTVRTIIIEIKEDKVKWKMKIYKENKEHESMKSSNLL
jgi:hypothetical protein